MSVAHLQLFSESILEVPLLNGAAPVKVPAGGSLTLPPVSPSACVLVKVTGTPMAGTTYDLFSWAGAVAGAPQLSQFQLHNSPPGHLKFNAAGDTLQFTATATGGWDAWRAANFTAAELADNSISGPAADPDADGLDNLAEYTLGALPKSADSADRFNTEDTLVNGIPALAIRFSASRTATDVFIEPETAVSLTDWEPASLDATGHKTDSAIEYVAWIPRNGDRRQLRVIFRR